MREGTAVEHAKKLCKTASTCGGSESDGSMALSLSPSLTEFGGCGTSADMYIYILICFESKKHKLHLVQQLSVAAIHGIAGGHQQQQRKP